MNKAYTQFLNRAGNAGTVSIYGAGKFARTLYHLLTRKGIRVSGFVVSDTAQNPAELYGKPVRGVGMLPGDGLVVGMEKCTDTNVVLGELVEMGIQNIIPVPFGIINDVYCNFVIDGDTPEHFCRGLAGEKEIIAYVTDREGEMVVQYLRAMGIRFDAVYTGPQGLSLLDALPVIGPGKPEDIPRDAAVLLTMGRTDWQRVYIRGLRELGFERIVLISDEIGGKIREDYRRAMWEEGGAGFRLVDTPGAETGHYIVQKEENGRVYRWRKPVWEGYPYDDRMLSAARNGDTLGDFGIRYPGCSYLPCTEVPLHEVTVPDSVVRVYLVKCHTDKRARLPELPEWVVPIQAGRALTDIRLAGLGDDTGDSISVRNKDYSEGTALYWVWKNTHGQDYVGLFHYRRQMALGRDSLQKLLSLDVVLTVPTHVSCTVKEFFCNDYIYECDWNLMMWYIRDYCRDYHQTALVYEKGHCYFPCNIFIMRRKHFDEMCGFIFTVTEKVREHYERLGMVREDRFLGFLVENLLSIYIMHRSGELDMAYTDMKYCPLWDDAG